MNVLNNFNEFYKSFLKLIVFFWLLFWLLFAIRIEPELYLSCFILITGSSDKKYFTRSFSSSSPRLMDADSDPEPTNWSDNASTVSSTSESSHEDNLYGDRHNNQWFKKKMDNSRIWDYWHSSNELYHERYNIISDNSESRWNSDHTKPLVYNVEPSTNSTIDEINSILLNMNEELKYHADQIYILNGLVIAGVDEAADHLIRIQWHKDRIKDVTEDQSKIKLAFEDWEEFRLASLTDYSNSTEYIQSQYKQMTENTISPLIQEIIIKRTNSPREHIFTLADGLLAAGYISVTIGGILLAFIIGVDIFNPHIIDPNLVLNNSCLPIIKGDISELSIEWKPKDKGKRSYSTKSLNQNYVKSAGSNSTQISMKWELNQKRLTGEYIAGFVQADGSFSAVLTSKTRDRKQYFNISLVFTIVQHEKYKDLILEIQKYFGGIGNWYFNKNDKTIRYQVTKQSDLLNVIIPFFMKHQLRSGKLLSFLHFKYIATVMSTRAHWNNKKMLLSLIVLASHLNPLGKLGNKIRFLSPEEQNYVINNIQPEGVDISKLTESIQIFKQNKLTLEFIHGLFDGDGGLSLSLLNPRKAKGDNNIITVKPNFTIVQDLHNISLLDELKIYFNDKGYIHKLSNNCSIYSTGSKSDLITVILPKMVGKEANDLLNKYSIHELNLPLIKYNKIYYAYKILELDLLGLKNEQALNDVIVLLYNIINNTRGLTLEQYADEMKRKLINDIIIEDIV